MSAPAGFRGWFLVFLPAVLALAGAAAISALTGPQPGPWKNPPERFILATGIPCVYQKDTASPTTVVGLFIAGGRSAVPSGLDGLAAIATRLLLEIPDEGKIQDLMAQATRLSYVCQEDFSIVIIECLTENLEQALQVAAKIIQDPLISGLRVGRAKDLMETNRKIEEDDAVVAAHDMIMGAFFGGRGYGSAPYGTEASLKAIDRKTVLSFTQRLLVKPNVFFLVETDLERGPVRRLLEKQFAAIPDGAAADLPRRDPVLPEDLNIDVIKDNKQTYVGRAYALPRTDLGSMAKGVLLETLLGKGPGSRLWPLRVDERLAYNVDADLTWTKSAGILVAYLEAGRAKSLAAAASLDRELAGLYADGVKEGELEAARTMARARFLRAAEAKSSRLRTLGLYQAIGPGVEAFARLLAAIEAVTRDDLNAFIRDVLDPARAVRVTVGPAPEAPPDR